MIVHFRRMRLPGMFQKWRRDGGDGLGTGLRGLIITEGNSVKIQQGGSKGVSLSISVVLTLSFQILRLLHWALALT